MEQTSRRGFLKAGLAGLLSLSLVSCGDKRDSPRTININGAIYQVKDGVISQATKGDGKLKLGIMADLHAHQGNSQYFADQLNKEGVEAFFLAGDLSHSFGDQEGVKDDFKEIQEVVEPIASTGKLVLVIPGNHEQKRTYSEALKTLTLKYKNIVDMERTPVADLDDLTIVALGGNANPRFCIPKGFLRSKEDFSRLKELVTKYQNDKPLMVGTHAPRRYKTSKGLDFIRSGKNVGLFDYFKTNRVSGHIHEASGIITPDEKPVKQGELVDLIEFNPGAVHDYCWGERPAAGILEFIGNKVKAHILRR